MASSAIRKHSQASTNLNCLLLGQRAQSSLCVGFACVFVLKCVLTCACVYAQPVTREVNLADIINTHLCPQSGGT